MKRTLAFNACSPAVLAAAATAAVAASIVLAPAPAKAQFVCANGTNVDGATATQTGAVGADELRFRRRRGQHDGAANHGRGQEAESGG
jgi:hypothetical protein